MMNIEHIKSLSLKDYLANKGHYPVKEYTTYGMYRSPFREESSPSFKVDYRANLWYDFGCGEGGSIIDLVMKLHGCTLSQAIGLLDNCVEISPLTKNDFDRQAESGEEMKIIEAVSLHHPNLLRYLQDRKIDCSVAKQYCREVHYQVKGRTYYAIGMPNDLGGYAIRNLYFKGCFPPSYFSSFDRSTDTVNLFEGFMDYLSFCTLYPDRNTESAIVLNSVNNLQKAHSLLSKYAIVNAYLDNDAAGKKTLEVLRRMNLPVNDCSSLYGEHKDLNDFLCRKNQELISPPRMKSRGLKR